MWKTLMLCSALFVAAAPAPRQSDEVDLAEEIRSAVRWLRSVQDPLDGSYGGGVTGTAWALRAFAECPDRYRPVDGPFVRRALEFLGARQAQDGSIADADATGEEILAQTRLAARALAEVADQGGAEPLGRALARLGDAGLKGPGWDEPAPLSGEQAALALAMPILAKRQANGAFEGAGGPVVATARAVVELTRAERVLARGVQSSAATAIADLPEFTPAERERALESMLRGARFLVGVADKGRWGTPGQADPGVTAMVLAALEGLPEPRPEDVQATIDAGLAWILSKQHEDGSIHDGRLASYTTSAAILALVRANRPQYEKPILAARAFLQRLQVDEGESYSEGDVYYGGIGYGSTERPDLSNLQMALEALSASGLEKGDPTYTKALRFLERCQNRSESNDVELRDGQIVIVSGNDGGAGYKPGDSKAGFVELEDGTRVPRSYGSMTYALLKCFVFAGLDKQDPRLRAAWDWCRENYTLDVNPGFVISQDPSAAYQGLFYYFYTMARALDAFGEDTLIDGSGRSHAWRSEVCGRMLAMQSKIDGSWINHNSPRWWEGNPVLASAYALMTLHAALDPSSARDADK
jgi:squalene-hopene/tetraprenyl-beta-curcumene cyclase